jgi:prolipoprotein diacylglyceryltransferase
MLDLLVSILDSLFDLIGHTMVYVIGGVMALGIIFGIPFGIYQSIRENLTSKKKFKKFIFVEIPFTLLAVLVGVGLGYLIIG